MVNISSITIYEALNINDCIQNKKLYIIKHF